LLRLLEGFEPEGEQEAAEAARIKAEQDLTLIEAALADEQASRLAEQTGHAEESSTAWVLSAKQQELARLRLEAEALARSSSPLLAVDLSVAGPLPLHLLRCSMRLPALTHAVHTHLSFPTFLAPATVQGLRAFLARRRRTHPASPIRAGMAVARFSFSLLSATARR